MIRKHSTRGGHGETRPLRCGMPPLARHLAVQSLPNKRIKALHLVMKRAVERAAPLFERVIGIQAGPFDSVLQEETSREVAQVGLYADCCLARQPKKNIITANLADRKFFGLVLPLQAGGRTQPLAQMAGGRATDSWSVQALCRL